MFQKRDIKLYQKNSLLVYSDHLVYFFKMLTIHLEEADCFAAWLSAKEVGMGQSSDGTDLKRKFVLLFLS